MHILRTSYPSLHQTEHIPYLEHDILHRKTFPPTSETPTPAPAPALQHSLPRQLLNYCLGRDSRFGISVTDICKFPELGRKMSVGFQFDRFRFPSSGILLWNRTGVSALTCGYESREVCCVTISLLCQIGHIKSHSRSCLR